MIDKLAVGSWNTANVTDMFAMFSLTDDLA